MKLLAAWLALVAGALVLAIVGGAVAAVGVAVCEALFVLGLVRASGPRPSRD